MTDFHNRSVCLLGAGVSNMPLAKFLLNLGAGLTIRDKKPLDQLGEKALALAERGVRFVTGDDYLLDIREEIIFRSPGFRPDLPEIAERIRYFSNVIESLSGAVRKTRVTRVVPRDL